MRTKVSQRAVGTDTQGEQIRLLRIRYTDGRKTIGVSNSGGVSLFGRQFQSAKQYVRNLRGV